MKKLLIAAVLLLALISPKAEAHYYHPVIVGASGSPFWAFFGATTFGFAVVFLNAEGVSFPLCGVDGLLCHGEYPSRKNGG